MSELALLGGTPALTGALPSYRSVGENEKAAVMAVLESGSLSGFYGSPGPEFLGGPRVRALEEDWARHCGTRNAISVNSATSGLITALGVVAVVAATV